jgi:DNA repair protein RadC
MFTDTEITILDNAANLLQSKLYDTNVFTKSAMVKEYCQYNSCYLEHEQFSVLLLNNQHELIESIPMFRGTINSASVYPREVVKEVLKYNASALILTHNHPSGMSVPSKADKAVTERLKAALKLIDVSVLDHIIVGNKETYSFAENGLI